MYGEAAYLAYYFHWPRTDIMQMSRRERHRWLGELGKINDRITRDTKREMEQYTHRLSGG